MKLKKRQITAIIKDELTKIEAITFAYIFGSFIDEEHYGDIDIAIYLADPAALDLGGRIKLAGSVGEND